MRQIRQSIVASEFAQLWERLMVLVAVCGFFGGDEVVEGDQPDVDPAHDQIRDTVTVKGLQDATDIEIRRPLGTGIPRAQASCRPDRARSTSSRNRSTASRVSSTAPSALLD